LPPKKERDKKKRKEKKKRIDSLPFFFFCSFPFFGPRGVFLYLLQVGKERLVLLLSSSLRGKKAKNESSYFSFKNKEKKGE